MKNEYDSSGVYFAYFLLSLLGLYLFPATYRYAKVLLSAGRRKDPSKITASDRCHSEAAVRKRNLQAVRLKRTWKNPRISRRYTSANRCSPFSENRKIHRFVAWVIGWIVFVALTYMVMTVEVAPVATLYDPYEILGISSSATEEQIRKQYKVLSLKWHPDKNQDKKEEAEQEFVKISKAYQSLTDDEVRKNWEEFGNPDGKQTFTFGIALPSWIVDPSNTLVVLGVYALLFGLLLPYVVSKWWSGSKKFTKDNVLNYTMGIYFQELKEGASTKKMIELLCASMEFKDDVEQRGQRDMDAVMALFRSVKDAVYAKTGEKLELPKKFNAPYCYKAFTVLFAHIFRVPIDDPLLRNDSYTIIPKAVHLTMKGMMQICSAHFWLQQSLNCVEISRMLIQAVASSWNHMESSELMQLPYFQAALVKHLRNRKKPIKTIEQFMSLPVGVRKEMLITGGLNEAQVDDVLAVGREYPVVSIEKAYFECAGEDTITPESLVTFVLKLKAYNHIGEREDESAPEKEKRKSIDEGMPAPKKSSSDDSLVGKKDSEGGDVDEDEEEMDEDGSMKRSSRLTKLLSGAYWENPNRPVYCPYYPELASDAARKRPVYLAWLSNPRNNRVVGTPIIINNLVPKTMEESTSTDDLAKGYRVAKFRFQAPPQPGTYVFTVVVYCDSFVGIELRKEVKMVVSDVAKTEEAQWEKQSKDAWKDLEEEERLERELGITNNLAAARTVLNSGVAPNGGNPEDEDDTGTSDSEEEDSDDEE